MEDAVANTSEHHEDKQNRVGRRQSAEQYRAAEEADAGEEQSACAEMVDDEPGGRLAKPGSRVEEGRQQAKVGISDVKFILHQREEDGNRELEEMAYRVSPADQGHGCV